MNISENNCFTMKGRCYSTNLVGPNCRSAQIYGRHSSAALPGLWPAPAVLSAALLMSAFALSALADDSVGSDKSQYNLFNPTPAAQMREWHTDRAGVSPYTCDAGHFEADVFVVSYTYDKQTYSEGDHSTAKVWAIGAIGLKAGLLNNLDMEVSLLPYEHIAYTYSAVGYPDFHTTDSGFGDVDARLNWNLWGNDGGPTALSVSGLVKFPTASDNLGNGQVEGGPALEFAVKLPYEFEMRVDSFVKFYEDDANQRQAAFENLLSFSHNIIGKLGGFCVFDTWVNTTSDEWRGTIAPGLGYRPIKNVEMFARVGFGVNGFTYDYSPSLGIALRF